VPFLSQTDFLELDHDAQDDQDSTLLLEFLRPFSAVKTLLIYRETSLKQIARALEWLTDEEVEEVLPMLDAIEGFDPTVWDRVKSRLLPLVQPFLDARQQSDRPVVVQ